MFGNDENSVLAYIYNREGKYAPPIMISIDPEQIASFLVMTKYASKVVIINNLDEMELCTLPGGVIDRCSDQEFLGQKLLPILTPMQQAERSPESLDIVDWDWSQEEVDALGGKEGVIKWYNEKFNTQLSIK